MVKNHCLAKSISDASWRIFFDWLEYYGKVMGKIVFGVNPQYTSQECPNCKAIVKKTLSQRTHICECGCVMDRDEAGAINILAKALRELSRADALPNFQSRTGKRALDTSTSVS